MAILQEALFTAFLSVILAFVLAKIVTFAVSISDSETPVAKETTSNSNRVQTPKSPGKKPKFVDRREVPESADDLDSAIAGESEIPGDEKWAGADGALSEDRMSSGTGEVNSEIDDDLDSVIAGESETQKWVGGDGAFSENRKSSGTGEVNSEIDDDWEGIERSELEKVFAEAVNYVEYGGKGKGKTVIEDECGGCKFSGDVQMELYGLHKVAVEGSCREPRPMALKLSARAKWNAWNRLGSMSRDLAMEQYIRVLSDNIPDWMHHYSESDAGDEIQGSLVSENTGKISEPELERKLAFGESPVRDSNDEQSGVEKVG